MSKTTNVRRPGIRGYGFKDEEGKFYLVRCPKCERENYAGAVASGSCAWCGWKEGDSLE